MDLQKDFSTTKRVSWGSIIAGVVTVLALSMLLSTLGTSLGLSLLSPQSSDVTNGAGTAVVVWSLIGLVISLAGGAFITGRLAGVDGAIHGFLLWATSLIIATLLGIAAIGGILNTAGKVMGSMASMTGNIASSIGSVAGNTAEGTANAGQKIADYLGFDTKLDNMQLDKQLVNALRKTDIKQLQPEYLQSQLQAAAQDTASAAKQLVTHPDNSDAIMSSLTDKLKLRSEQVGKAVDKDKIKHALTENSNLSPAQADEAVENFIQARDKAVSEVNQRLDQVETKLEQAKGQYAAFKQQALQKADEATSTGAKVSLWSFVGLLLGAVISTLAGLWGVNTHPSRKKA